jgi:hypothetical protein
MYIVIGTLRSRVIFSALLFVVSVSATLLLNGYGLVGLIATHYMVVCAFFLCVFFQFMLASDPSFDTPYFESQHRLFKYSVRVFLVLHISALSFGVFFLEEAKFRLDGLLTLIPLYFLVLLFLPEIRSFLKARRDR